MSWTTPISQLIRDDFVLEDDYSTLYVTLQDALLHRTGLPRHDLSPRSGEESVKDVVRSLRYLPMTEPLRTTFQYCNLMYVTIGHVIETLTGQWEGDFLAQRIWEPLNMTSTYFSLDDALNSGNPFARGYNWAPESRKFVERAYVNETSMAGAGAVLSTVVDYAKWMKMLVTGAPPLSAGSHQALVGPQMVLGRGPGGYVMYAYGWVVQDYRGVKMIWHNGGENGVSHCSSSSCSIR